jgi:hypothetical protein
VNRLGPPMLASTPASILNQNRTDLGMPIDSEKADHALVVEPQEVVPGQAESADGRL